MIKKLLHNQYRDPVEYTEKKHMVNIAKQQYWKQNNEVGHAAKSQMLMQDMAIICRSV